MIVHLQKLEGGHLRAKFDNGSTDETAKIARAAGAQVLESPWG